MPDTCDNEVVVNLQRYGHCYKLCPFSEEFYTGWEIDTGVVASGTLSNIGNSYTFPYGGRSDGPIQYPFDFTIYGTAEKSVHITTSGNMITKARGGGGVGWMCSDDACTHYLQTGVRHFEL